MSTITFTIEYDKHGNLVAVPASQSALTRNTTIRYVMGSNTNRNLSFTGYTSNDSKSQLGPASISSDGQTMDVSDQNSQSETLQIVVNCVDSRTEGGHSIPTEVRNIPPN
ncbi:MAG: hypothetical protein KDI71_20695 [Xanthomonadales bacterium]|nr:hypothetical protein [Xanthomonadales bacterium]